MVVLHIIDSFTLHILFAFLQSKYKHGPLGNFMPLKTMPLLLDMALVYAVSSHRHMMHWISHFNSIY